MRTIIAVNPALCNGCRACEMACALGRAQECNPERARIRVLREEMDGVIYPLPLVCRQCEDAPCVPSCPEGALSQEPGTWVLRVDEALCTGCGLCEAACPIAAVAVDPWMEKAMACDLCGGKPRCVPFCHSSALTIAPFDRAVESHGRQHLEEAMKRQGLSLSARQKGLPPEEYLWAGNILRVDLTREQVKTEPTSSYAKDFIGGRGISTRILYDEMEPGVSPLSEESILSIGAGPLVGLFYPGAVRTDVMAKSPVTGFLGESSIGGFFGAELRMAGFDHIVLKGKAPNPSYLYINNDQVELRDATHLWGKDCYELPKLMRDELKEPRAQILCVGPAGENQVVYASIHTSMGNAAGRTGMGAVMGSKNLKAIVVRGTKGLRVAEPEALFHCAEEAHKKVKASEYYEEYHKFSATRIDEYFYGLNPSDDPVWGWEKVKEVNPYEFIIEKHLFRKESCFGCPLACLEAVRMEGVGSGVLACGAYQDFTWGPKVADPALFWQAYLLAQRKGLDTRACGQILNWLMELYEKEMITDKDTDGIVMLWGSGEATLQIMEKLINRQGIGDVLAKGLQEASKKFGKGSIERALAAKANPLAIAVPPMMKGYLLACAVASHGDGVKGTPGIEWGMASLEGMPLNAEEKAKAKKTIEDLVESITGSREAAELDQHKGKAAMVCYAENEYTASDIMGHCTWIGPFILMAVDLDDQARVISLASGKTCAKDDILDAAIRTRHIERAFNVREGLRREHDALPKKFFQPMVTGHVPITPEILEEMKDEYYEQRGWNQKTGIPLRETLERFGLRDVVDDLEARGISPR